MKRQIFAPTSINSVQMDGGVFVYCPPSAFDIQGSNYVVCEKHPNKTIPVNFNFNSVERNVWSLQKLAIEALRKCPGCLDAEAYKNTRFPEGAEL